MKNIIEQAHKHKKATALLAAAFLCAVVGILYITSKPAPQDQVIDSNSACTGSSVKVKVADISPTSSTVSGGTSSKAPAQKIDIGNTASGNAANYKPETAQPRSGSSEHKDDYQNHRTESSQSTVALRQMKVPARLGLGVGESVSVNVEFLPADAEDKRVVWKSSDEGVVKVDNTGMVTGIAVGSCTITVQAASAEAQASISVAVSPKEEGQ